MKLQSDKPLKKSLFWSFIFVSGQAHTYLKLYPGNGYSVPEMPGYWVQVRVSEIESAVPENGYKYLKSHIFTVQVHLDFHHQLVFKRLENESKSEKFWYSGMYVN